MKKLIIAIIFFFTSTGVIEAQSKNEKALESAIEQLRKAMVDADSSSLSNITSDKLSYGHSSGAVEDKAAFIGKISW